MCHETKTVTNYLIFDDKFVISSLIVASFVTKIRVRHCDTRLPQLNDEIARIVTE